MVNRLNRQSWVLILFYLFRIVLQQIENHENYKVSDITRLCLTKQSLARAFEGLMAVVVDKGVTLMQGIVARGHI